jgi:hypothetical protein
MASEQIQFFISILMMVKPGFYHMNRCSLPPSRILPSSAFQMYGLDRNMYPVMRLIKTNQNVSRISLTS